MINLTYKIVENSLSFNFTSFYMETQRWLVVPRDGGELEVFTGGQNPHSAQVTPAEAGQC